MQTDLLRKAKAPFFCPNEKELEEYTLREIRPESIASLLNANTPIGRHLINIVTTALVDEIKRTRICQAEACRIFGRRAVNLWVNEGFILPIQQGARVYYDYARLRYLSNISIITGKEQEE